MNPASRTYAYLFKGVYDHCIKRLEQTQQCMEKYYDHARKEPPPYSVSDLVILNGKQIRMPRAAKKLDAKLFGPFKVK